MGWLIDCTRCPCYQGAKDRSLTCGFNYTVILSEEDVPVSYECRLQRIHVQNKSFPIYPEVYKGPR